jgi:Icc-related predicted phosphoesterase
MQNQWHLILWYTMAARVWLWMGIHSQCRGRIEGKMAEHTPDVQILITHGPPAGILDFTVDRKHAGSMSLLAEVIQRIKPKLHIFGHIHEGHGICSITHTMFINASICDPNYLPIHSPIVLETS